MTFDFCIGSLWSAPLYIEIFVGKFFFIAEKFYDKSGHVDI